MIARPQPALSPALQGPLTALKRFAAAHPGQPKAANKAANQEKCELCAQPVDAAHQHLVEIRTRRLVCACEACAVLFSGQQGAAYRRVPRQVQYLPNFELSDAQWDSLLIPINLAFFFYSTPAARVLAVYPSPAGATESLLGLESWQTLVDDNPLLAALEPDVEALLVNRMGPRRSYFRVPIDECYKLVGLIRRHWHGISGGLEVWEEVGRFFERLQERSQR